jgi:hypothetical protein
MRRLFQEERVMQYLGTRSLRLVKLFTVLLLGLPLVSCALFDGGAPMSSPTTSNSALFAQNPGGSFDVDNMLHIDVKYSFFCGYPVLATDQSTYDPQAIQQMADYMIAYFSAYGDVPLHPLPVSLKFAQGIFAGTIANWNIRGADCQGLLYVTNIGQNPVQIMHIGMKLAVDVAPNTYHYHLMDICSLPLGEWISHCPSAIQRVVANIPTYTATFHFTSTEADTVIQSQVEKQLIISPGATISLKLVIPTTDNPRNGLYVVMPQLTVKTQEQANLVLDLFQLTSTIAFIDPETQLSCNQLQGNTFVPLEEGTVEPQSATLEVRGKVSCL